jgi:ubiquinone/menaquinone biosynthesis C-methylase UbiE
VVLSSPAVLKEKVKAYWEASPCGASVAAAPRYSVEYFEEIEKSRYRSEPFIHCFAQFTRWRGKKVLEIGCGAGTDSLQFARAGAELYSVDLTSAAVELTRRRLAVYGLPGDVRNADAETLPFPETHFDLVYSWGVLHHTPDTQQALHEVFRVLKVGGRFVIMLYNRHSLVSLHLYLNFALRARRPFRSFKYLLAHHMESADTKGFTRRELRRMFSRFEDVEIHPVITTWDAYRLPRLWLPPALGFFQVITGRKPARGAD